MKIGLLYSDSPTWPKMRWVHRSFEQLGHQVVWIRGRDDLAEADKSCDLVVHQHKAVVRWPNLRTLLPWTALHVQWWFDLVCLDSGPLRSQVWIKQFADYMRAMHVVFVKDRVDEYAELGINAVYLDQGFPEWLPTATPCAPEFDLLLWGQGGACYRERFRDAKAVADAGFKVAWAGNSEVPKGVQSLPFTEPENIPGIPARCLLSVGRRNDEPGYWSDSLWLACGTGRPVIRKWTPGLPDLSLLTYRTHDELIRHVRWCCENGDESWLMGQKLREQTIASHTLTHRCQDLLAACAGARAKST